ncbi:MAG: alpha/beta hydrolase [Rhodobacterales bacterium]
MKYMLSAITGLTDEDTTGECVVMLHGLARSSASFFVMQKALEGIGYRVINVNYASKEGTIEEQAMSVLPDVIAACDTCTRMHFVTHSMGGIMLRYYLQNVQPRPENLGRCVMLAPPNKGTPLIDKLEDVIGFELLNGVAGKQLGTGAGSLPNRLGGVDYPVGIIAGNKAVAPLYAGLFDGENDGKVSVESTKLDGMADHIVLPVTHTFLMNSPLVFKQVAHFLREGFFLHET